MASSKRCWGIEMDDLDRLEDWLTPLVARLEPRQRTQLAKSIAFELRKENIKNIKRQMGPNGERWEKRKKTRNPVKPIRYYYRARDGHEREIEMTSYRNDGDRIIGYDKEANGIRTMLKTGMLRSMPAQFSSSASQKRKAQYMLTGFARNRFMRVSSSPNGASVFFSGSAQRLARIHHFGLRDSVYPGGPEHDYSARELLGIGANMPERISGMIINHLAES